MTFLRIFGLLALALLSVTSLSAQSSDANAAITLERTACFGTCPIYTVTILEDGTVLYNGERFVEVTGEQTSQIDPETVAQMVEAFEAAGYFEWDGEYTEMTVSDAPSVITSVTRNGETHQITRYGGDQSAPAALPYLEAWIDIMANTGLWTGVETDIANLYYNGNAPVATLQRTPCFGFCPVYDVAVFEDGTIVYVGTANVDQIGVHVYEVHPDSVTSVVHRAELSGFFDWEDSYDYMLMTDLPYFTTSIRMDDQSKRILRYGGDPNAPVGLTWVEDSIDQLVAEAMG